MLVSMLTTKTESENSCATIAVSPSATTMATMAIRSGTRPPTTVPRIRREVLVEGALGSLALRMPGHVAVRGQVARQEQRHERERNTIVPIQAPTVRQGRRLQARARRSVTPMRCRIGRVDSRCYQIGV